MRLFAIGCVLAVSGCQDSVDPAMEPYRSEYPATVNTPGLPDLARCDEQHVELAGSPLPGEAVSVPEAFRQFAAASPLEMAISTKSGATLCANSSWISQVGHMEWLSSDRFLGWEWSGFESFGYLVADRQGQGALIETGTEPVFSPSGNRFAGIQISESQWGDLEGFGVWQLDVERTASLSDQNLHRGHFPAALVNHISGDWGISRWVGESCIEIYYAPYDATGKAQWDAKVIWHASESESWTITAGYCQ